LYKAAAIHFQAMAPIPRIRILVISAIIILLLVRPAYAATQSASDFPLRYNQVIVQVHRAELAGATAGEVADLVVLLNEAMDLYEQGVNLTGPQDTQRQAQLFAQADQIMNSVETQADQLEIAASQRTLTNKILAYGAGVIASLLATIAYFYGVSFWRRYRIKRTFQMRIIPK
jgi:triphosphoribosyl-dephospho-CoA synthetase